MKLMIFTLPDNHPMTGEPNWLTKDLNMQKYLLDISYKSNELTKEEFHKLLNETKQKTVR